MKTELNRTDDTVFWGTLIRPTATAAPFVTGEFNRDGPCDGTTNSWAGFIPAAKFTPVG